MIWHGYGGDGKVVLGHLGPFGYSEISMVFLLLLYGLGYFYPRSEGLPSRGIQLFTLAIYAVVILGLRLHDPKPSTPLAVASVQGGELRRVLALFVSVIGGAFLLSVPAVRTVVWFAVVATFIVWTPLGFVLTGLALAQPWRDRRKLHPRASESILD